MPRPARSIQRRGVVRLRSAAWVEHERAMLAAAVDVGTEIRDGREYRVVRLPDYLERDVEPPGAKVESRASAIEYASVIA